MRSIVATNILDHVKEQEIMRIQYGNTLCFFERLLCKTGSFLGPFWGAVLISLSTGLAIWMTGVFMKQYKAEATLEIGHQEERMRPVRKTEAVFMSFFE